MLLNETQLMVRDMARRFAAESLAPFAAEWDKQRTFPRDALRQMGELGLLAMLLPTEWDGAGMDHVALAVALEEIAAGDGATSTIMSVTNSVVCAPIYKFGTPQQQERWLRPLAHGEIFGAFCLTEPHAGSDAAAIKTRAQRTTSGWCLHGTKQFITTGKNAAITLR